MRNQLEALPRGLIHVFRVRATDGFHTKYVSQLHTTPEGACEEALENGYVLGDYQGVNCYREEFLLWVDADIKFKPVNQLL